MNYVEWLRVRNVVRNVAIVLGVMLVLGLAGRIWIGVEFGNAESIVSHIQSDPDSVTTHTTYNGQPRTIIVNVKKNISVTIDDRANGKKAYTIVRPATGPARAESHHDLTGTTTITTTTGAATTQNIFENDEPVPFAIDLVAAYIIGLIVATIFGASFARENNGHLEFAMLRPVSRERFALGVIAVDIVGIILCELLALVAFLIGQTFFGPLKLSFHDVTFFLIVAIVMLPVSWYALLNAASASLKRGSAAVVGFAWPVCAVVVVLGSAQLGDSLLGQFIHNVFHAIAFLIPLNYATLHVDGNVVAAVTPFGTNALLATILFVIYGALAIVQWRRVEA